MVVIYLNTWNYSGHPIILQNKQKSQGAADLMVMECLPRAPDQDGVSHPRWNRKQEIVCGKKVVRHVQ